MIVVYLLWSVRFVPVRNSLTMRDIGFATSELRDLLLNYVAG